MAWQEINSSTPRDRFIILWCREDDSYWWAKWQSGMWHGVDEQGLTRDSENFTPDLWCEIPKFDSRPRKRIYDSYHGEWMDAGPIDTL